MTKLSFEPYRHMHQESKHERNLEHQSIFEIFPHEIWETIVSHLPSKERYKHLALVSKEMHAIATNPITLRSIHVRLVSNCDDLQNTLEAAKYLKILHITFDITIGAGDILFSKLLLLMNSLDNNNQIEQITIENIQRPHGFGLAMANVVTQMTTPLPALKSLTITGFAAYYSEGHVLLAILNFPQLLQNLQVLRLQYVGACHFYHNHMHWCLCHIIFEHGCIFR